MFSVLKKTLYWVRKIFKTIPKKGIWGGIRRGIVMSMVEIYYVPGDVSRNISIDDVLAGGIKSRAQLIKEGKLPSNVRKMFDDQCIFKWFPPHLEANKRYFDWVSIEVRPESTFVFNQEFRYRNNREEYYASRMTLADYISQHEKTKKMRGQLQGEQKIIWHPRTAEPEIVSANDKRTSDWAWLYHNEILIPRAIIPPSEFKRHYKAEKSPDLF